MDKEEIDLLRGSIQKLHLHCEKEGFKGYSLYDSHNSFIPFEKFGKTISFLTNQVVKRSPVNIRSLLGVKKGINPKGVGLFLHSYSLLVDRGIIEQEKAADLMKEKFLWLKENPSKNYSGYCWGYNYDWPRGDKSMFHAYTPSVVVTAFICRGLMAYYKVTGEEYVKTMIKSACEFVKNDVACTITAEGRCYSYTPAQTDLVINASLLAAEILAYDDYLSGETKYLKEVTEVLNFTLSQQNEDGSWYYCIFSNGKPKKQIDFHQGYVVDSIDILTNLYDFDEPSYKNSMVKGIDFYFNNQFNKEGYAYWRIPTLWPIDIHNQSQAVLTLCRFSDLSEEYLPFALKVFRWTIKNMRSKSGRFYYQKYRFFTNKTDYLRWNQGWMLLAMTSLENKLKKS